MVVGLPLILEGQPAVRHMIEVLQPLEVGHSHAPRVDVQVWDDEDVSLLQDGVCRGRGGAVGRLRDDLVSGVPMLN